MIDSSGSSPRPWGTPLGEATRNTEHRFIPTPVGNTNSPACHSINPPVHPHARGEHHETGVSVFIQVGSSPRPWGTLPPHGRGLAFRRFIPTPVGNTTYASAEQFMLAVHPHARGEHARRKWIALSSPGSSPRPWGTHINGTQMSKFNRFIPTPVGNTRELRDMLKAETVHPHARGEHECRKQSKNFKPGSSPRPWGTR